MIPKVLRIPLLAILPLLFLVVGLNFNRTWFSVDPEYAYLLNGVNIATLHSVGHTDNPGTPVQMYSAVVLRIAHLIKSDEKNDLKTDVLQHPEYYVELERKISVVLNFLMLFFLGVFSVLILKNIWYSLILQVTAYLSSNLLENAFTKVSPEPVLIFILMILILLLIKFYIDYDKEYKNYPWIFGLISGVGLATKATFLPLALLPVLLLKGKRQRLIYLASIIPFFILFTIPAIPQYPHMAKWFLGLSTHTGTYGQGGLGIFEISTFFLNLPLILVNNPAMACCLLVVVIFIIYLLVVDRNKSIKHSGSFKFMTGIAVVQILGILMVAKHYHANHYLIPVLGLTGIMLVFALIFVKEHGVLKSPLHLSFLAPSTFIVLLLFGILNMDYLNRANQGYILTNEEYTRVKSRLETEFSGYVKTYYYPISFNIYSALRWGNVYSRDLYQDELRAFYPKGLFFDWRSGQFQWWEANLPAEDLVNDYGGKILLVGGPMSADEKKLVENDGLVLKELYHGRTQAIYEVDTSNSLLFKGIHQKPVWEIKCGADSLSSDKKWFPAGPYKFQNNDIQSNECVRSGEFAVRLASHDTYGMQITVDSVKPGQRYRFSAWRKAKDNEAFLVASSEKSEEFYSQNAEYLNIDNKGWKKVVLEISIPENFKPGKLKFYLWNNGYSESFFDDLTLRRMY